VEAPKRDGQAIQSIDMQREIPREADPLPDLTHHHVDHVSGNAHHAAEAPTTWWQRQRDYFRKLLARPETLTDSRPKTAFTPKVIEVDASECKRWRREVALIP